MYIYIYVYIYIYLFMCLYTYNRINNLLIPAAHAACSSSLELGVVEGAIARCV